VKVISFIFIQKHNPWGGIENVQTGIEIRFITDYGHLRCGGMSGKTLACIRHLLMPWGISAPSALAQLGRQYRQLVEAIQMFGIDNYPGFILAGILLNLTPGSDTIYILTRSISQGRRAGIVSVLGIISGCLVHTICAAFGLSLVLKASATLFAVVRYAGAGYLMYLGIKMLKERTPLLETAGSSLEGGDLFKIYRQGFLTNLLNPKVALFFLSFLPQFIHPSHTHGPIPFLILGGTFLTTGTLWCLFLAYAASRMTAVLRDNTRIGSIMQKLSGVVFIGLGLQIALKRN
jgi:threonine/homoserine/homoserine lactone efflux protein